MAENSKFPSGISIPSQDAETRRPGGRFPGAKGEAAVAFVGGAETL